MATIEIKHLELIKTIAKTENLTRAAQRLNISQPALSRRLLDIEERLGTSLFFRSKKRMMLTPEGTRMLKSADAILNELETVELEISKIVNGDTGNLRIGVSCLFCFQWLPAVVAEFQQLYPKVDISVSTSHDAGEDLKNNAFDMVITATPVAEESFAVTELFRDEMVAIAAPDHPLSARRHLTAQDIMNTKLIVGTHLPLAHFRRALWPEVTEDPLAVMRIDVPNAVIELVGAGVGISFAPRWAVDSYLKENRLKAISLGDRGIHPVWKVIHLKQNGLPKYRQSFIDLILKQNAYTHQVKQEQSFRAFKTN